MRTEVLTAIPRPPPLITDLVTKSVDDNPLDVDYKRSMTILLFYNHWATTFNAEKYVIWKPLGNLHTR